MGQRWGLGPVFAYEWLMASRRWQLYALRALVIALLGVGLTVVWWNKARGQPLSVHTLAVTGESFFYALVGIQLALVLLAAPAYTAGAVCLDRARGTLLHLLATDLSDAEIVLGKLAARLIPVLGLVLASVPVLFAAILLGGIDPAAALGAVLVSIGTSVLGCALALTLSVWGRKPHEVLLIAYLLIAAWLLAGAMWAVVAWGWGAPPPPAWLELTDPFQLAFLPYLRPGTEALPAQATFLGATVALAAVLALVAVLRLRAVTLRQAGRPAGAPRRSLLTRRLGLPRAWLPGPSMDFNPVLWREWRRHRPSRWLRLVWLVYGLVAAFFTLFALAQTLRPGFRNPLSAWVNGLQVAFGLLLLTVGSVTSLADERAGGTLDLLLTTPLPTWSIVLGKWWGSYRTVLSLAVLPLLLAAAAVEEARGWVAVLVLVAVILVHGASVTSLGLALATWVRRTVLALSLGVVLYVLVTVGWVFLVIALLGTSPRTEGAATASTFYAAGGATAVAHRSAQLPGMWEFVAWVTFWLLIHLFTALALLGLTLATFNRCVGRMGRQARPRKTGAPADTTVAGAGVQAPPAEARP
jgi:ABC-type transport system involved in multi-copper enzyme maturation permease subunit